MRIQKERAKPEITIFGKGPWIAVPTFCYLFISMFLSVYPVKRFTITDKYYSYTATLGLLMIIVGLLCVISVARLLLSHFNSKKLITTGLFKGWNLFFFFQDLIF